VHAARPQIDPLSLVKTAPLLSFGLARSLDEPEVTGPVVLLSAVWGGPGMGSYSWHMDEADGLEEHVGGCCCCGCWGALWGAGVPSGALGTNTSTQECTSSRVG
jgi:hypothetical protein